jgi:hypothetical protein
MYEEKGVLIRISPFRISISYMPPEIMKRLFDLLMSKCYLDLILVAELFLVRYESKNNLPLLYIQSNVIINLYLQLDCDTQAIPHHAIPHLTFLYVVVCQLHEIQHFDVNVKNPI